MQRGAQPMSEAEIKTGLKTDTKTEIERSRLSRVWEEEFGSLEVRRFAIHGLCALLPEGALGRVRTWALRLCGLRLGRGTIVSGALRLSGPRGALDRLTLGATCFLNGQIYFDLTASISVGDNVTLGHHVMLVTADHDIGEAYYRCGPLRPRPIVIEDGAWIGAGATLLPGVTLGRGCVVAAGAVVRRDVPAGAVVGGVPARVLRMLGP
jgi:maltose O-acetyltransferase